MLLHIPDDTITQPQMSATPRRLRNQPYRGILLSSLQLLFYLLRRPPKTYMSHLDPGIGYQVTSLKPKIP